MDEIASYYQPFDHRLCFELALALEPIPDILTRYNVSEKEFEKLKKLPAFMQRVVDYRVEIKEKGLTFREKARIMAEDLLGTAYEMVHHPTTPANVKSDLIKFVTKVADLEPKPNPTAEQQYLPQIAASLKQLSDTELAVRVMEIVQKRQPQTIDVTPTLQ